MSAFEEILQAIIDGEDPSTLLPPGSRGEVLLQALLSKIKDESDIVSGHTTQLAENTTAILEKTGYGIISGLVVSAQTAPDMTVKVSAGVAYMSTGTRYAPAAVASLAITAADATNPRIDIIYLSSAGAISYLAGTAAASPIAPTLPTGALLLAEIVVAAGATTIQAANIALRKKDLWAEDWIDLTMLNGYAGTARCRKYADGTVEFYLYATTLGTANSIACYLPAGYLPHASMFYQGTTNSSVVPQTHISSGDGSVRIYGVLTGWAFLSVRFSKK